MERIIMNKKQLTVISIKDFNFVEQQHSQINTYNDDVVGISFSGELKLNGSITSERELAELYKELEDFKSVYEQLSGHFWIVVIDKSAKKILFANDHLGIKPCYYTIQNNLLYLCESLKIIKKLEGLSFSLSKQAIYNYLYFRCIPSPLTIYCEVNKLEPGTMMRLNAQEQLKEQIVFSPEFAQGTLENTDKLKEACLSTIDLTTKDEITDDCGAFLSGGLDSSTVAGMLAKHQSPARTFSIGFDAAGYDETPYAILTAKHFGTEHEVLYLKSEQAAEAFINVSQYFDEPFGNSSAMAAYFCGKFAKEKGVSKLLAGDGGDELFAGNERYAKQKQFEMYYKLPSFMRSICDITLNNKVASQIPLVSKASSYVRQAENKLPGRLQSYNFVNIVGKENMFDEAFLAEVDSELPVRQMEKRYHQTKSNHPVDQMLFLDWKFTLADNDLVKVNKMCELAGIDVAYPLISKELVELSCKVPADVKLPGNKLRHFYKETVRGFLADETLDKSKHGFGLPFGNWLKENDTLKTIAMDALSKFKTRKIVKDSLVEQAIEAHKNVHASYYGELIWILVVLELWLQKEEEG